MNAWASNALDTSASTFLAGIRATVPVSLIATPRERLICRPKGHWQQAREDSERFDFDQIPLTGDDGIHIEAVYVRGAGVAELREDMFMAADAPLIAFLESADRRGFRLLLENSGVSAMVTLSDIQKLPAYLVIFSLLIAVEMLLMAWIRKTCGGNEDAWLHHLSTRQRSIIEKHWSEAATKNVAIDRLSCASLGQEVRAASGIGLFEGNDERYRNMVALERLRHQIFHAADFAPTPELALEVPGLVRNAQAVAEWLQVQLRGLPT